MQVYRQTIRKIRNNADVQTNHKEIINNAGVQTNHKEDNKQCRCTDKPLEINNAEDFDNVFVNISKAATFVRKDIFETNSEFKGTFPNECQKASVPKSLLSLVSMIQFGPNIQDRSYSQSTLTIAQLRMYSCTKKLSNCHMKDHEPPDCAYFGNNDSLQTIREIRKYNSVVQTNDQRNKNQAGKSLTIMQVYRQTIRKFIDNNSDVQTNHKEDKNNAVVQTNHKKIRNNAGVHTKHKEVNKQCKWTDKS
ncbi:unnamed protein product [Mytilus edulis]|uniref:Uncharacterized protein n=1 Tax=Mytilus edulis TaxID=6550 RepID=A0A8S3UY53_MYTED|nr:unnamed protein product [Mytilus edulis]